MMPRPPISPRQEGPLALDYYILCKRAVGTQIQEQALSSSRTRQVPSQEGDAGARASTLPPRRQRRFPHAPFRFLHPD